VKLAHLCLSFQKMETISRRYNSRNYPDQQ
jgi:hypothetical protein